MLSTTLLDPSSASAPDLRTSKRVVGLAVCVCAAGAAGLLGSMGSGCPAHSALYDKKFWGGGLEGTFREVVGQLLVVPYFMARAWSHAWHGRVSLACCLVVLLAAIAAGQLADYRGCSAICGGVVIVYMLAMIATDQKADAEAAGGADSSSVLKSLAIVGGLFALVGRQLFEISGATPTLAFWTTMFGRFLLMLPFLWSVACLGIRDFQSSASELAFPAAACFGRAAYGIAFLGPAMNFVGSGMSSFACSLTFLKIRVSCWIAIPGSELLLLSITVATLMIVKLLASRSDAKRSVGVQDVICNAAIVGCLTNLTGSDVWYL